VSAVALAEATFRNAKFESRMLELTHLLCEIQY
jgi:hypothetical protein